MSNQVLRKLAFTVGRPTLLHSGPVPNLSRNRSANTLAVMDSMRAMAGSASPSLSSVAAPPTKEELLWNTSHSIAQSLGRVILGSQDRAKAINCIDSVGAQNGQEFMALLEKGIFERLSPPKRNSASSEVSSQNSSAANGAASASAGSDRSADTDNRTALNKDVQAK